MKISVFSFNRIPLRVPSGFPKVCNNKWFLFLLVIGFATGCKKVIEETGLVGICPEIVSSDPANGALNVATMKRISATFNEAMDASTINATTFLLKQGTTAISGTISYSGTTASFTPSSPLAENAVYTATITKGSKDPAGNAMISDYVWSFNTGRMPTVVSTDPINEAINVGVNKIVTATFSTSMNAATVNAATFTIKQGAALITGVVTYNGMTATFTPTVPLTASTVYTGTITTGAKDEAGNEMMRDYTWSFVTGAVPTVTATDPANAATGVSLDKALAATFSEAMDASTINSATFLLKQGTTAVPGTVTYSGVTATFTPSALFAPGTVYTATITTGAKNTAGNALANNYNWSFTTAGIIVTPPSSILGSAAMFGIFGGNAGVTNQGLNTIINNGSIGTTAASTLITGFKDGTTGDLYTVTPLNEGLVTGRIYTAPPAPGNDASFAIATQGALDANAAYIAISPASRPGGTDPGAGELGGLTLPPGVYKSASGTFGITNGNLTLDAMGDPNAEWIFQTAAGLTVGLAGPAGARSVIMINQAQAKNVYWHVGSAATINAAGGGVMAGTIIASAGVTFSTAGNAVQTVLNGRALSLNASVTLVNTTINVPN